MSKILKNRKYPVFFIRILLTKFSVFTRIVRNYFIVIFLKRAVARKLEIGITYDCQCKCEKCSSFSLLNRKEPPLTAQDYKLLSSHIVALGVIHLNITGGEPLLNKSLFEILAALDTSRFVVTINTNGLLLDREMIDKLEKAGVDIIKISIDSPVSTEHDSITGVEGSFRKAQSALAYIKGKRFLMGQISTVCTKEIINSGKVWDLLRMAKEYNALLGINIPAVTGRWSGNEAVLLNNSEIKVIEELLKDPCAARDTEGYLTRKCPAGAEEFYLTCYGDVIPCPFIQISFGNIKRESIINIWRRMSNFNEFTLMEKSVCLAAENKNFIRKYLLPLNDFKSAQLPVHVDNYKKEKK